MFFCSLYLILANPFVFSHGSGLHLLCEIHALPLQPLLLGKFLQLLTVIRYFMIRIFFSGIFLCVPAGRMRVVGCRSLAFGFPGQLRHPVPFLPRSLGRQPHHHTGHCCHGDGFPGLPGCHQGEQVSAAECE